MRSPMHRDNLITAQSLIQILNSIPRCSLEAKNWHELMENVPFGDYIRVQDLADAFGLMLDGQFDEARNTSEGFSLKDTP